MGLRHVVLLTLDDGCDVDGLLAALRRLPEQIPELRGYVVGRDAGISEGNATVAVVADVDDEAGFATYRDHPAHVAVVAERIRPHLVARTAVQHHIERAPSGNAVRKRRGRPAHPPTHRPPYEPGTEP